MVKSQSTTVFLPDEEYNIKLYDFNKKDNYYDLGKVDEDYTITLDFSDATISKNYLDSKIYMELLDTNSNIIRPTLYNTINTFNLYSGENNPLLSISSDYKNETSIELNSNSQTNIQVNSKLVYSQDIIDTSYENDEMELGIKLVDENDSIVTSDNLNNIIVKYKDKEYHAGIDNIFHIKLDGIKDVNDSLQIITYENDNSLKIGNYYFKLFNYISNKLVNNNEITINAKLTREKIKYKYELNVNDDKNNLLADEYRVLADNEKNVIFGGRLAEYKYYDMDDVIKHALEIEL